MSLYIVHNCSPNTIVWAFMYKICMYSICIFSYSGQLRSLDTHQTHQVRERCLLPISSSSLYQPSICPRTSIIVHLPEVQRHANCSRTKMLQWAINCMRFPFVTNGNLYLWRGSVAASLARSGMTCMLFLSSWMEERIDGRQLTA